MIQKEYECLTLFPSNIKDMTSYAVTPEQLPACNFIAVMQQIIHDAEHLPERLYSEDALTSKLDGCPSKEASISSYIPRKKWAWIKYKGIKGEKVI